MRDLTELLEQTAQRYEKLCDEVAEPAMIADTEKYREKTKEIRMLTPIIEAYHQYRAAQNDLSQAQELLSESGTDAELTALAQQELSESKQKVEDLNQKLTYLLLARDPNDGKNIIMEIRAGVGGEEAALFAAELFRMYGMFADNVGYRISVLSRNETGLGGLKEITFSVEGEGAYSRLKLESGTHRVQRVPKTESNGKIQTSAVTVAVLPEAEEVEIEIKESDLKIETIKSSGAGGQHINKTESAVRIIHLPSGMVVECQDERSQFKNRDKAMKLLRSRLLEQKQTEQNEKIASDRRNQVGSGDRSQKIRTYNFSQGRVTDHRIGMTVYSLEDFLNGNISKMLDALSAFDTAQRLNEQTQQGKN